MPACILSIGSNEQPKQHICLAQRMLKERFAGIRFSAEQETEPLYLANPARFINQVALFETELSQVAIRQILKEIERCSGRLPEDKQREIVRLDIDLLTYGDALLKPEDREREYVVAGMRELNLVI